MAETFKYFDLLDFPMFEKISKQSEFEPFGELSKIIGGLKQGDLAGVITTDQLTYAYLLHLALSSFPGNSYYLDVSSKISSKILESIGGNPDKVFFARVYSIKDVISALNYVEGNSLFALGSINIVGIDSSSLLQLKKLIGDKALWGIFFIEEQSLNELDLISEARRLLFLPELFEQLIVARTTYYRGRYKLTVTVLRTYPERLSSLGDHELIVDEEIKKILSQSTEGG